MGLNKSPQAGKSSMEANLSNQSSKVLRNFTLSFASSLAGYTLPAQAAEGRQYVDGAKSRSS